MEENLRQKTTKSFIWNAIEKVGVQILFLIIGIVTFRLLTPEDFGLIGALTIFTLICSLLIDSGFSTAMIRRNNNTDAEYAAIFYFNLLVSVFLYIILFFTAPLIASFFNMPELRTLSRFIFISLIVNNLGIVQNIILTKKLAFKSLSIANVVSLSLSGIITVILIYCDLGYWSLAWQQVILFSSRSLLLWIFSSWRLSKQVDFRVIKELFSFSGFLILNGIFSTIVRNVYNLIIGRLYSGEDLGFYYQANKFQQIPSTVVSSTLSGVAYPVLSELNINPQRQLVYFRKIIRIAAFVIFPVTIMLYLLAEPLFLIAFKDKWLSAVPYFQILLIASIFLTFYTLNGMIVLVKGRAKHTFFLETIRNILIILSVLICFESIDSMLYGFLIASILSYLINLIYIGRIIQYTTLDQFKDIMPYCIISLVSGAVIYFIPELNCKLYCDILIRIIVGGLFYCLALYLLGSKIIIDIISIFQKKESL